MPYMYLIIGIIIITVVNTVVNIFCIIRALAAKFIASLKKNQLKIYHNFGKWPKICPVMAGPLPVISQKSDAQTISL